MKNSKRMNEIVAANTHGFSKEIQEEFERSINEDKEYIERLSSPLTNLNFAMSESGYSEN